MHAPDSDRQEAFRGTGELTNTKTQLASDFPATDEGCKASTGKTLADWYAAIDAYGPEKGRRDVVNWIYNETERGRDMWWSATMRSLLNTARLVRGHTGLLELRILTTGKKPRVHATVNSRARRRGSRARHGHRLGACATRGGEVG